MHTPATEIPKGQILDFDVCIIGAGAAGITLAVELLNCSKTVCLLESGDFHPDEPTQALYKGYLCHHAPNHEPIDAYRCRTYGGTTVRWGGACLPLDDIDYEKRSWVPHSGWPFGGEVLQPYYARAAPYTHIDRSVFDHGALPNGSAMEIVDGIGQSGTLATQLFKTGAVPNFATDHHENIRRSTNVTLITWANITQLLTDSTGERIEGAQVKTLDGNGFTIRCEKFVLAMGGLETPRLLLASNRTQPHGIGNNRDQVGRFYSPHFNVTHGLLALRNGVDARPTYENDAAGVAVRRFLTLTDAAMQEHELLNCKITLEPAHYVPANPLTDDVRQIINDDGFRTPSFLERIGLKPDDGEADRHTFALDCSFEQVPNPSSRVTLTSDRDELNMPRLRLDYRIDEQDIDNALRTFELIALAVGEAQLGRFCYEQDTATLAASSSGKSHHIGTTRMADAPEHGVVDADGKVFGVGNLFIASSAVFPTHSHANPTFTIVALAIRLADHLKGMRHAA